VVSFDAALDGWDFDRFWTEYPLNKGKQRALQEWERQVVKPAVDPRVVIAAAVRYRDECERDGTFFAHASSWLHQHRWEDEPAPVRVQPPTSNFGRKMAALRAYGARDESVTSRNGRVLASSRAHSLPRGATDGDNRRDNGTP